MSESCVPPESESALSALCETYWYPLYAFVRRQGYAVNEHLKGFLTSDADLPSHAELAELLAMTEGSVKVAIHRLRRSYRDALRAEIGHTVCGIQEIDDELNCLLAALRGR